MLIGNSYPMTIKTNRWHTTSGNNARDSSAASDKVEKEYLAAGTLHFRRVIAESLTPVVR